MLAQESKSYARGQAAKATSIVCNGILPRQSKRYELSLQTHKQRSRILVRREYNTTTKDQPSQSHGTAAPEPPDPSISKHLPESLYCCGTFGALGSRLDGVKGLRRVDGDDTGRCPDPKRDDWAFLI